jgi:O-phosphoseryl-tRNA(Cys) synthetase
MLTNEQLSALQKLIDTSTFEISNPSRVLERVRQILAAHDDGHIDGDEAIARISQETFRCLSIDAQFFNLHETLPEVERTMLARYADRLPPHLRVCPEPTLT